MYVLNIVNCEPNPVYQFVFLNVIVDAVQCLKYRNKNQCADSRSWFERAVRVFGWIAHLSIWMYCSISHVFNRFSFKCASHSAIIFCFCLFRFIPLLLQFWFLRVFHIGVVFIMNIKYVYLIQWMDTKWNEFLYIFIALLKTKEKQEKNKCYRIFIYSSKKKKNDQIAINVWRKKTIWNRDILYFFFIFFIFCDSWI